VKRFSMTIVIVLLSGLFLPACGAKSGAANTPIAAVETLPPTPLAANYTPMKVTIGLHALFPPFETVENDNRRMVDLDLDLMNAIAGRVGLEVEYVNVDDDLLLDGIAQCQYDAGISAIIISDELKQWMNFSDPYYTSSLVVVVKKGNVTIAGPKGLAGMTVGSQTGTPGEIEIQKIPGVQYSPYDNIDLAYEDLIAGLIDAVVSGKGEALNYVSIKPANLKLAGDEFAVENYAIAVCKQNAELLNRINVGLADVKADGTLDQLVSKWLTTDGQ
jgi:polar amino acid transport system substrate-binding protein